MKILVVSDTHGRHQNFDKVLEREKDIDMLIHMGDVENGENYIEASVDCPVHMVAGNNDFFSSLPKEKEFSIGKYKVFITHGHYYYVSMETRTLKQECRERNADIVMYGHTHQPDIDCSSDVIAINPGSLSYPRQEGRKPTYIVMEIDEGEGVHFELKYV